MKITSIILIVLSIVTFGQSQRLVPTAKLGVVDVALTNLKGIPLPQETVIFENPKTRETFTGVTDNVGKLSILVPGGIPLKVSIDTPVGPFAVGNIAYPHAPFKGNAQLQFENRNIPLNNVLFESGSATLKSSSSVELNKLVEGFKKNPALTVEIAGHTDNVGNDEYNMKLSEARAQSVVKYLVSKGVSENAVRGQGYGETQPVGDNNTARGKAKNRRIEMRIISQ